MEPCSAHKNSCMATRCPSEQSDPNWVSHNWMNLLRTLTSNFSLLDLSLCSDPRRKGTSQSVVKGILPAVITILTLSLKHRPMLLSIIVGYHYAIKHQGGWAWFPSSGCLKSLWITGPHASPSFCKQHKSTKEIELASAWLRSTHSEIQCGGKSVRSPAKVKGETITGG